MFKATLSFKFHSIVFMDTPMFEHCGQGATQKEAWENALESYKDEHYVETEGKGDYNALLQCRNKEMLEQWMYEYDARTALLNCTIVQA